VIIGVGGEKGAGKDTLGQYFCSWGYKRVPFALPIRKILAEALQLPFAMFEDQDKKETPFPIPYSIGWRELNRILITARAYGKVSPEAVDRVVRRWQIDSREHRSPREMMQYVGTDLIRHNVDGDFWCQAFLREASQHANVVVPDCRFPNERAIIRKQGGLVVRIRAHNFGGDGHISENSLGADNEYDHVFNNTGTVVDLWEQAGRWVDAAKA
jgi:hypothetical protein